MNTSDLFYQSALINALIFLWVFSSALTIKILLRADKKISFALVVSILLGPLALIISWIFSKKSSISTSTLNKDKVPLFLVNLRSIVGVILVALLIVTLFYIIFVLDVLPLSTSHESLLKNIAIFVLASASIGGIILSFVTGRIAFFESMIVTLICALAILLLKEWADEVFSYGTSAAYFSTLIGLGTTLMMVFLTLGGSLGYLIFGEGHLNLNFAYEYFIGTRFLMTKRSSQVVSLITVISVIAVMIACCGMIVVMSVMNGFTSDLKSKIIGANAHLMILKYGKEFPEYQKIIEKTKDIPGVIGASAFIVNEGMVHSNKNISTSIITGIDLHSVEEAGRLQYVDQNALAYLKDPKKIPAPVEMSDGDDKPGEKNDLPGVIIGKEMASSLQVIIGDVVNLVSPIGDIGPTGPIPRAKPFRVAGYFNSGMYEFDAKFAFIALSDAQDFFNLKNSVTGIEYRLNDVEKTRPVAKEIEAKIGGYPFYARDWMQMNRNMFSALQLEKIVMLIILSTYIFMASLLILVTLIMVVMEKGKEIAILKSMGATDVSIMKIFVTYGLFIGSIGALAGGTLGLGVCLLIEKVGIRLDPDVYYFSNLPVKIVPTEILLVVIAAILISFLATIPPALFAARLKPVEGLRYE